MENIKSLQERREIAIEDGQVLEFIRLAGATPLRDRAHLRAAKQALEDFIKQTFHRREKLGETDRKEIREEYLQHVSRAFQRCFINAMDSLTREMCVTLDGIEIDAQLYKKAIKNSKNKALALQWIVSSSPMCSLLGVDDSTAKRLRSLFSWSQGFSTAFAGGQKSMSDWFSAHGFQHITRGDAHATDAPDGSAVFPVDIRKAYGSVHSKAEFTQPTSISIIDGLDGVQQVVVNFKTASSQAAQQCVALLVKVPNLHQDSSGRKFGLEALDGGAASEPEDAVTGNVLLPPKGSVATGIYLPAIQVGLGTYEVHEREQAEEVRYDTFVLTAPRVHFFLLCAHLIRSENNGMRLAGVHGAGKSTMLRAMASILSVGSPTDVWYLDGESVRHENAASAFITTSTGQMVQNLSGREGVPQRGTISGQSADAPVTSYNPVPFSITTDKRPSLTSWLHSSYGSFPGQQHVLSQTRRLETTDLNFKHLRVSQMKLTLFDEVNSMLMTHQDTDESRAVRNFLYWNGSAVQPGCLKILASSPDGAREGNQAGYEPDFFELRPAPAEHMAAVLLAAPECFVSGIAAPSEPHKYFEEMVQLCGKYGSNSRYITLVLQTAKAEATDQLHSSAGPCEWLSHVEESQLAVYDTYLELLAQRMIERLRGNPAPLQGTKMFAPVFDGDIHIPSMLRMNASLIVRSNPCNSRSQGKLVGRVSYDAQIRVVHRLRNENKGTWGEQLTPTNAMALFEMDASHGSSFESAVRVRLYLGALCRQAVRINQLQHIQSIYTSTMTDLRSPARDFGHLEFSPLLLKTLWRFPQVDCKMPTIISCESCGTDVRIPAAIHEWMASPQLNDCLIISPGDNFPFCDYIVVYKDGSGAKQVVFIEATTSTLERHSSSKNSFMISAPQEQAHSASSTAAAAGGATSRNTRTEPRFAAPVDCPASLRDIFLLVDKPKFGVEFNAYDRSWTFKTGSTGSEKMSVGNAWLTVLGVPLRFCAQYDSRGSLDKQERKFQVILKPVSFQGNARSGEDSTGWKVAVLYISGQRLEDQGETAEFSQLDCEFVYCMYKQHGDVLSSEILSGTNSPAVTPPKQGGARKNRKARRKKHAKRKNRHPTASQLPPAAAAGGGGGSNQ